MEIESCEIYKGRKLIGILPYKFFKKTDLNNEYFLLANSYAIKPGYTLIINQKEKLYVTDVRLHSYKNSHINVFFETVAQHNEKQILRIHDWINTGIAVGSLISAIISLIVSLMQ